MRVLILVVLVCAGCAAFRSEGWGGAGGSSSYSNDDGTVHRGLAVLTRHGMPYLVILTVGGEAAQVSGGPPGRGTVRLPDGRDMKWTCDTPNGIAGKVTIDGQAFELERGPVFLVDLRSGKAVVEQIAIAHELMDAATDEQRLKADNRIARFYERTERPK
jgi:hypothetical protein